MNRRPRQNPVKEEKRTSIMVVSNFFKTIIIIILILAVTSFAVNALFFGNVNNDLQGNLSSYSISNEAAAMAKQHRIVNLAVFGVAGRDDLDKTQLITKGAVEEMLAIIVGTIIPYTPFGASMRMTGMPLSYFPWLIGMILYYMILATFLKTMYRKRYGELL